MAFRKYSIVSVYPNLVTSKREESTVYEHDDSVEIMKYIGTLKLQSVDSMAEYFCVNQKTGDRISVGEILNIRDIDPAPPIMHDPRFNRNPHNRFGMTRDEYDRWKSVPSNPYPR